MQKLHNIPETELKVAVVMGGVSNEREVSLKSGKAVANALKKRGVQVVPIDLKDKNIEPVKKADPDVAFIALHGEFGEDGQIQSLFDEAGIPYTGSGAPAARIGMDKKLSKRTYIRAAVPTPPYTVLDANVNYHSISGQAKAIGYPLVCKPPCGGSSINVHIVHNEKQLCSIIERWRNSLSNVNDQTTPGRQPVSGEIMVEKFIHGRELTVGMLDGEPMPVVEIVSHCDFFDYRAKYEDEKTQYVLPVSMIESVYRKVSDTARRAYNATGCRHMARVDMIYGYDGNVYVLELNTIPGMTSRSLLPMAAEYRGIRFPELCERLCYMALASARTSANVSPFQSDSNQKSSRVA